ncbi:carbonic anhydrase [Trypanosoma grayi]|uniref:carbonic anhydrase n=1 Tax=Trypanosoma grayi TaxID=71804 RepID=UPI0004F4102C|nr:carbonic anhydrase [Trypanosoma grayi]KEG11729.1 carbonic anhydrase [Trypanosoma grayi]
MGAASIHNMRHPPPTGVSPVLMPLKDSPIHSSCCHCSSGGKSGTAKGGGATKTDTFAGGRLIQSLQHQQPPRGSGIQPLLEYNRQWANKVAELDPGYFKDLSEGQSPQYLWIGCSDSRVPANEVVGLFPGDVFVHQNVANIVSNSDLNVLSVLQYAIECLKVEHVIVTGHYGCGGVKAALDGARIGLADHWILHVSSVKRRFWKRMEAIPQRHHFAMLCELNVITQLSHILDTQLMQHAWDPSVGTGGNPAVELHGWIYGLEDGILRPLLSLNRDTDHMKAITAAEDAIFLRYGLLSEGNGTNRA